MISGTINTISSPKQPAIYADDVWRIYTIGDGQEVAALRGIQLNIEPARFVALKGRSGSGKTTLLNCLGGLDQPTRGSIKIFGVTLSDLSENQLTEWRRTQVGFIFQSFGLIPTLSAFENVELASRITGRSPKENRELTMQYLALVGLTKWMNHRPNELSGGQQQRVAIARALVNHPKLILADEPTGELDSTTGREILELFNDIKITEGTNIFISSHDSMVDEIVDEVVNLIDGQISV